MTLEFARKFNTKAAAPMFSACVFGTSLGVMFKHVTTTASLLNGGASTPAPG